MPKIELIEMKEIISQINEIISLQKNIDELRAEVKRLNALHNEYNANKNTKNPIHKKSNSKREMNMKISKNIFAQFLLLFVTIVYDDSNPFFAPYIIFIKYLYTVCVIVYAWLLNDLSKILLNKNTNTDVSEQSDEDSEHDRIYDELCEKRSHYHALQREQSNLLTSLSCNNYQIYLEYIEFCRNLDEEMKNSQESELEQLVTKEEKRESFLNNLLIKNSIF